MCACSLLWSASTALAGERPDFRINDDASGEEQSDPRVAVAPDGSFVVVWADKRSGQRDIYIQSFDTTGNPVGDNVLLNDDTLDAYQTGAAVAADFTGRYTSAWLDYRPGESFPFDPGVYLQRIDTGGVVSGANISVSSDAEAFKDPPDIAASAWGKTIIVWADNRRGNWDIWCRLLDSDGVPGGPEFAVNDLDTYTQHAPRVASSPLGWFIVTWYDNRLGNDDIFVQRFDSSGIRIGPNVKINTDATTKRQVFPDIATDGAGRFTVVWTDYRNGTYPDIYAERLDTLFHSITGNVRLSTDPGTNSQTNPAIASDRMGNVAIVWADSGAGSSWDIAGQMIDASGVVQEVRFEAHETVDSVQIKPDVALDGTYRYVTWMDRRNGNYDIYASIEQYNDPALTVTPDVIDFEMRQGGPIPDSQYITVQHAGYNPIAFEATSFNSWLSVTPSASTTPDSVAVAVATDTLPNGVYTGAVRIIDPLVTDSTAIVPVRLTIASAVLELSADTLPFVQPVGYDTVLADAFSISNSGPGQMTWSAHCDSSWLSLSETSGSAPAAVDISVSGAGLSTGTHVAPVVIDAGLAVGSPDTVWVTLEASDTIPVISVTPSLIDVVVTNAADFETSVTIINSGGGDLNWTVSDDADWLTITPSSGSAGAVSLSLDEARLPLGVSLATMHFTDSTAFNNEAVAELLVDYDPPLEDTVAIPPLVVLPGDSGVASLQVSVHNRLSALTLPIRYDTALIKLDSLAYDADVPIFMDQFYTIEPSQGILLLQLTGTVADTFWADGDYDLARLYFTAGEAPGITWFDTVTNDTLSPSVTTVDSVQKELILIPGEIVIDQPTDIDESTGETLPQSVALHQNYPNPFNAETIVAFELPRSGPVELTVFNVLGRQVSVLVHNRLSAGLHRVSWSGMDQDGGQVPSGIYFYRLQAGEQVFVRKMILVK